MQWVAAAYSLGMAIFMMTSATFADHLGLEGTAVKVTERGFVEVDEYCRTAEPGVYALGDLIDTPALAHVGYAEAILVTKHILGENPMPVAYDRVPWAIYCHPEVASIGITEAQAKEKKLDVKIGKFPFSANGRAKANQQTDGFVKILADAKTDRVLGVHIIGADAGNMIAEAAVAMEFGASSEDIARTCHAHPTLPEAVKEAALAVAKRAIHM